MSAAANGADLPDFLVIGAAKAGTTALFRALGRHPRVFCSPEKEPRFFALGGRRPQYYGPSGAKNRGDVVREEDYRALFAGRPPGAVAGEASTYYLYAPLAPAAAFRTVPRARLVAVLRHPVERAFSHYLHLRQESVEPLADFAEAWEAESDRIARGWHPRFHYRERGFYARQLDRWLELFPREQLLILFYEDWLERPREVLNSVFAHLGIEALDEPVVTRENVSSRQPRWAWLHRRMVEDNSLRDWAQRRLPLWVRDAITLPITAVNLKAGPGLDPGLRARLAATYHEDLDQVEAMTGRDLGAWRS